MNAPVASQRISKEKRHLRLGIRCRNPWRRKRGMISLAYVRSYGGKRPPGRINRLPPKEVTERVAERVHPQFGESILGYIARLAQANMVPVSGVQRSAGLDPVQIWYSDRDLQQLATYAQQSAESLRLLAPEPPVKLDGYPYTRFMGHLLDPEAVYHDQNRRVCPACLKKDAVYKATWDLRIFPGCTEHGLRLIHHCPDCSAEKEKPVPLNWRTEDLRFCRCGCDLREVRAEEYPAHHQGAQRLIEAMLMGTSVEKPPLLAELYPHEIMRLLVDVSQTSLRVRDLMFPDGDIGMRMRFGEHEGHLHFQVNSPEPEVGLRLSLALTILSMEPADLAAALTGVADGFEGRWFPFGSTISSLREPAPRGKELRQLFEASEHRWTSKVEAMSMQE